MFIEIAYYYENMIFGYHNVYFGFITSLAYMYEDIR